MSGACEVQKELVEVSCVVLYVEGLIGAKAGLVHDSIENFPGCAWMCPPRSVRFVCRGQKQNFALKGPSSRFGRSAVR